jgi:hypothetical protein
VTHLTKCWRAVVHRHIEETEHLVDMAVVKAAHDKRCEVNIRSASAKWNAGQWYTLCDCVCCR